MADETGTAAAGRTGRFRMKTQAKEGLVADENEKDIDGDELQEQIETVAEESEEEQRRLDEAEEDLDADEREYREAERLAAEEDAASQEGDGEEEPEAEAEEEPKPEAAQEEPPEDDKPVMIPKGRFDQVLRSMRELERQNAYLAGQLKARPGDTEAQPDQKREPDPEEEFDKAIEALDEKYDNGDLSLKDRNRQERELRRERDTKMAERQKAQPREEEAPVDVERFTRELNDDPNVLRHTRELEQSQPWLKQPTPRLNRALQEDLAELQPEAIRLAEAAGYQIAPYTKVGTMVLRTFLVQAALNAGLDKIYGRFLDQPPSQPQTPPQKRPGAKAGPTAEERRTALERQRRMPPDINQAGSPADAGQGLTAEKIMQMSEDEIAALPDSELLKAGLM